MFRNTFVVAVFGVVGDAGADGGDDLVAIRFTSASIRFTFRNTWHHPYWMVDALPATAAAA